MKVRITTDRDECARAAASYRVRSAAATYLQKPEGGWPETTQAWREYAGVSGYWDADDSQLYIVPDPQIVAEIGGSI